MREKNTLVSVLRHGSLLVPFTELKDYQAQVSLGEMMCLFSFGSAKWDFLWNSTPCRNQEWYLEIEIRHRSLEIISIWIVTKVKKVGDIEMKYSIGEKKPKKIWCPHNQEKKVVQKKKTTKNKKTDEIVQEAWCMRRESLRPEPCI